MFDLSPYLSSLIRQEPAEALATLADDPQARREALRERVARESRESEDDEAVGAALRRFKRDMALLAALADIGGVWPLEEVTLTLSQCADDAVRLALAHLFRTFANDGLIVAEEGEDIAARSGYFVLGMGKLGGFELNYSSDIDLIVFFDPARSPFKAGKEPQPLFVRLTQRLVRLLQERTGEGYVFRTDLRLRPDPGATPVAMSVISALHYYETIGQTWERSAMIKARVIAGDMDAGAAFLNEVQPFVWRKYLDYSAIADIHAMKRQIHAFRGHDVIAIEGHNVKLGRGGIREIEFFVQTQQLIAAGRNPGLRSRETLAGLNLLVAAGWVKPPEAMRLVEAYRFLRQVEHRLQMVADEQTHTLPGTVEEVETFARFMGFDGRNAFERVFMRHARAVEQAYAALFEAADPSEDMQGRSLDLVTQPPRSSTLSALNDMGFTDPARAISVVHNWQTARPGALRSPRVREKLGQMAPFLLEAFARSGEAERGLLGFDRFVGTSSQPLEFLTLLSRHPDLLNLVCLVFSTAPRLSDIMARRVHVADALVDPAFFAKAMTEETIRDLLTRHVAGARDYEDLLDRLRIFGQEQMFLAGMRVLSGTLSADQAGEAFAALADAIITAVVPAIQRAMAEQHGEVPGMKLAVIAMGKLGGREMTANSDLDIIVLYDHDEDAVMSDGRKPLSPSQYFARFTQRLIAALSAPTSEGVLYDVDLRLRPSGRSGPIATRLDGFLAYQSSEAWTWEHMALTRARVVTASPGFKAKVDEAVRAVLTQPRKPKVTLGDIAEMREAVAEEKGGTDPWDLKYARGGLVDLEFLAQALQLVHGATRPSLLSASTARTLEAAAREGVLSVQDGETLTRACRLYHNLTQVLRLCLSEPFDPATSWPGLNRLLARAGDLPDMARLNADLRASQAAVKALFERLVVKKGLA